MDARQGSHSWRWHNNPAPSCRPFERVKAGLAHLSASYAADAGPKQLAREGLQADSHPSELHVSGRAPGDCLACCRVPSGHVEIAATAHAAAQPPDPDRAATGHADARHGRDQTDAEDEHRPDLLLLARPTGAVGESLQVYVLQRPPDSQPAAHLEVRAVLMNLLECLV